MGPCFWGKNARTIIEVYFDEVMFGQEVLEEVGQGDMAKPLHKWIGALQFNNTWGGAGLGTGCLISPNIVLTAAHNIYNTRMRAYNKNFLFYLAACGELKNPFSVEAVYVPEGFRQDKKSSTYFDYGLLKINGVVNDDKNFLELNQNIRNLSQNMEISIFGYPGSCYKFKNEENGRVMTGKQNGLKMRDKIIEVRRQKTEIVHMVSTNMGQSGAPIIAIDWRGAIRIIGVHKGGIQIQESSQEDKKDEKKEYQLANVGKLFERESLEGMKNWIRANNGIMFRTTNTQYEPFMENEEEEEEESRFHDIVSDDSERGKQMELEEDLEKESLNNEEVTIHEQQNVSRRKKEYKQTTTSMICAIKAKYFKKVQEYERAKLQYEKAVKYGSRDPEIHINLGELYEREQNLMKAARCSREAISCDPEYFGGYHYLEKICVVYKNQEIMETSQKFLKDKLKLGLGVKRIKNSLRVIHDNRDKLPFQG